MRIDLPGHPCKRKAANLLHVPFIPCFVPQQIQSWSANYFPRHHASHNFTVSPGVFQVVGGTQTNRQPCESLLHGFDVREGRWMKKCTKVGIRACRISVNIHSVAKHMLNINLPPVRQCVGNFANTPLTFSGSNTFRISHCSQTLVHHIFCHQTPIYCCSIQTKICNRQERPSLEEGIYSVRAQFQLLLAKTSMVTITHFQLLRYECKPALKGLWECKRGMGTRAEEFDLLLRCIYSTKKLGS